MVSAGTAPLPEATLLACKHRILYTFGAMVSGARMRPGQMAAKYVRGLGRKPQASVIGTSFRTTTVNAALANAMCPHSDETNDFEPVTKAHPGTSVVPSALAMGEHLGQSGEAMIRAVALGYDLACRLLMALRPDLVRGSNRSAEGTVSMFGSLGAAASLARLEEVPMRYALPYSLFYPLPAGELNDAIRINCCLLANFLNLLTETSLAFCPSSGLCMLRFQFSSR